MDFIPTKDLPANLSMMPDPPKKGLYVVGNPWPPKLKRLCIVGSRKKTDYGQMVLEKLMSELSSYPISIISGLALGIDSSAHKLALKHGLHTVSFPGSGLNKKVIYPASNRNLADDIINNNGGLVSEFEPDQKAAMWTFPQRNRLMAALSDAVLVVEAASKSGTLITARLALEYNKDVMSIPGSIFSPQSEGSNHLLAQGAHLISSSDDILELLKIRRSLDRKMVEQLNLSDKEKAVLKIIKSDPVTKDEIIEKSKLKITETLSVLTMLELKKLVTERAGKIYYL